MICSLGNFIPELFLFVLNCKFMFTFNVIMGGTCSRRVSRNNNNNNKRILVVISHYEMLDYSGIYTRI